MKNISLIASMVEQNTGAMFDELLANKDFKDLLKELLKTDSGIMDIVVKLSDYTNENLI